MSQNISETLNPRTIAQNLATVIEGTPAEKVISGLASTMRDKLMGALASMTQMERDEMSQRLMRMTPDTADSVIANVVGSGQQNASATTYTVRKGDSLSKIAKAQGVSLAALEKANPQVDNRDLIYPDQVLNIPRGQSNV